MQFFFLVCQDRVVVAVVGHRLQHDGHLRTNVDVMVVEESVGGVCRSLVDDFPTIACSFFPCRCLAMMSRKPSIGHDIKCRTQRPGADSLACRWHEYTRQHQSCVFRLSACIVACPSSSLDQECLSQLFQVCHMAAHLFETAVGPSTSQICPFVRPLKLLGLWNRDRVIPPPSIPVQASLDSRRVARPGPVVARPGPSSCSKASTQRLWTSRPGLTFADAEAECDMHKTRFRT